MSTTGVKAFDTTIQVTNTWLAEIGLELNWDDRQKSYHALRAVLHALRDRLPVNSATHLAAQLPMLVRGFYFEGWHPAGTPVREHTQDEFLVHVTEAFLFDVNAHAKEIALAVFKVMSRHITAGEVTKVKEALPKGIRELWP